MAYSAELQAGFLPDAKSSEPTNTIAQFAVVCFDTTSADGFVRPDSSNAGAAAGVNISTGVDSTGTGGVGVAVQPGNLMRVACHRIERVTVASGVTVVRGDKLYVTSSSIGPVTNIASGNKFVGYALEASGGGTAEIIAAKIATLSGT